MPWMRDLVLLSVLCVVMSLGCNGGGSGHLTGDPDESDGAADGDLPDGDLPDGDLPDGDLPDGDLPDGDLPDGDADLENLSVIDEVRLRTESGEDRDDEDLLLEVDIDDDETNLVVDWRVDGESTTAINLPFEESGEATYTSMSRDFVSCRAPSDGSRPEWIPEGRIGGALSMDGSDDRLECAGDFAFERPFSVETWVRPSLEDGDQGNGGVASTRSSAGWGWQLRFGFGDPGRLGFQVNQADGGAMAVTVDEALEAHQWNHVVATFDGRSIAIFLDGRHRQTEVVSGLESIEAPLLLGFDGWDNHYEGDLDHFRIHDRALSPEQIVLSFEEGERGREALVQRAEETSVGEAWQACVTPTRDGLLGGTECSNTLTISEGIEVPPDCEVVDSVVAVSEDRTYPAEVCLRFTTEGMFDIAEGVLVTIEGEIYAGEHRIFAGEGEVRAPVLTPRWLGAVADGASEDTVYVARALAWAETAFVTEGEYLVGPLSIPDGTELRGESRELSILRSLSDPNVMITVGSNCTIANITIDGDDHARIGVLVSEGSSGVVIEDTNIEYLRGYNTESLEIPEIHQEPGYGIRINSSVSNTTVRNTTIRHVNHGGDGDVGNFIGANRGILLSGPMTNVLIDGCEIDDIGMTGDDNDFDNDAIHVQLPGDNYRETGVTIQNCRITGFNKRGIKIQASGVVIRDNVIVGTADTCGEGIAIVAGNDNIVEDNDITMDRATAGVIVHRGARGRVVGNSIVVDADRTSQYCGSHEVSGIYSYRAGYVFMSENEIKAWCGHRSIETCRPGDDDPWGVSRENVFTDNILDVEGDVCGRDNSTCGNVFAPNTIL